MLLPHHAPRGAEGEEARGPQERLAVRRVGSAARQLRLQYYGGRGRGEAKDIPAGRPSSGPSSRAAVEQAVTKPHRV